MSAFAADPDAVRGAITPLVTPFTADGDLDLDRLPALVDRQLAHGSHGISVGGSTGEPTSQTVAERIAVMRATAAAVDGRCAFLPGTGSARLDETFELCEEAERLGATAALVVAPYYTRPGQEGLYRWFAAVAEQFPRLPLLVYNVPVRSAVDIAPETVGRLARAYPNVVGIKETTRDFEHVSHVLELCGRDFIALSGLELLCLPMLALGGRGHLSCVGNVAPGPVAELYDAWVEGDVPRAQRLHYELHPLVEAVFVETNPAPVKWLMAELGLMAPTVRPPLTALGAAGQARVRSLTAGVAALAPGLDASRAGAS